jgi:riboflavin kinase/FMN adenylyltransferase
MRLVRGHHQTLDALEGHWAVTLGSFDGVHRGHAAILRECKTQAEAHGLQGSCALSFVHHPRSVLAGQRAPRILTSLEERVALLNWLELDQLVLLEFDDELSRMDYTRFVREILLDRLGMKHFVLGHDVHFGRHRGGNVHTASALAEQEGFTLSQVASVRSAGEPVSSTRIRDVVARAEMGEATELLGHPFVVIGRVVEGRRLGRTLGFPTANLEAQPPGKLLPPRGVYGAWVQLDGPAPAPWRPAVVNVGVAPTVRDGTRLQVEAHVLDGSYELYGQRIAVAFSSWLREERKMSGLEELREAIAQDIERVRETAAVLGADLQLLTI